jgi:hypothetical protein
MQRVTIMGLRRDEPAAALLPPQPRLDIGRRLIGWVRAVVRRERERRELAVLRGSDFGDLAVPASLVADETRRWPWHKPSAQWREVAPARGAVREPVYSRVGYRDRHDRLQSDGCRAGWLQF